MNNGGLPFGFQQDPRLRNSKSPESIIGDAFYSFGIDGQIYQDQFMKNLRNGVDGYTGFPAGFGQPKPPAKAATPPDPLEGMPDWYKEWYKTQGQYGGVPPVRGIL
jgi:hypothetical protein